MKKIGIILLSILFLSGSSIAYARGGQITKPPLVCVDPGHGGTDSGATMTGINGTITEANENLLVAQDVEALLTASHVNWVATRNSDVTLSNAQRYTICNNAGATLELSIHMNASTNHSVDYTEVLYGKKTKDYNWAKTLDTAMAQLENAINTGLIQNNGITNYADGVLLKSNMPAALAETVFITSTNEYALLTDGTGMRQQAIAQQLANGILNWTSTH